MHKKYALAAMAAFTITAAFAQRSHLPTTLERDGSKHVVRTTERPFWLNDAARGGGGANDDCAGALTIDVTGSCMAIAATYAGATQSMEAVDCAGEQADVANDVWFSFVANSTSTTIRVYENPGTDAIIELFSGTCAGLTSLACADNFFTVGSGEELVYNTTVGETYYYRTYFWPYMTPPSDYSFNTCVFDTPPPPVNDLCTDATIQQLSIGGSITATGTSMGALDTEGLTFPSVWEAFTITDCADVFISHCGSEGNVAVNAIFSACPTALSNAVFRNSVETTTCPDGSPTNCFRFLPAGTYYVPLAGGSESYSIQVSANGCQSAATNDDCPNAITLTPNNWCNPLFANTNLTSESMPGTICNTFTGNANDDVWFSFVATQSVMTVAVEGSAQFDAVVFVMSGTCGAPTELGCADATEFGGLEEVILNDLQVGSTYYVRVYHWYGTRPCDNSFSICLVEGAGSIGIPELSTADWSVFPNPTEGLFTIVNAGTSAMVDLQVIDLAGRMVQNSRAQMNTGAPHVLDLTGKVAAGTYSLRIVAGDRSVVQRLMVN